MVGLYGGEPLEYQAINEQGSDAVPSSTGQVLGAAFGGGLGANLFPRLMRSTGRLASETGLLAVDEYGRQIMGEPDEQLDPEAANQQFGIKGALSFDKPVAKSVAQDLYDHKREQIERDDAITRRAGGIAQGDVARFTASMAAGLLDPVNLAVGLIPIVGEARVASLLGRGAIEAASVAERAGVRAVAGGVSGAAQMAALQPLEFALSKQEHEDYTMADALRSIALGTVLGGGLHAGTGALLDRATGLYRNPVTQRLEGAGPEARETLLQGALAQTIEGRPVDVAPALDAILAYHGSPHTFDRFDTSKIGTGEGAQAFGYGFYFAENPEIGRFYARQFKPEGMPDAAEGNLYRVRLNVRGERLLDLDKPLGEQSEAVIGALKTYLFNEGGIPHAFPAETNARDWLDSMGAYDGSPKNVSEALSNLGIDGTRYLDNSSRDGGGGSRNIVVFDQRKIEVVDRNGKRVSTEALRPGSATIEGPTATSRSSQQAVDNAIAAARREPAPDPAAKIDADRSPAQPSDTLQEIQKQAEDLERVGAPAASQEGAGAQVSTGAPPGRGLVVATRTADGTVYYGNPGEIHFLQAERLANEGIKYGEPGFAGPDGKFLTRAEALESLGPENRVQRREHSKETGELDALDYRETNGEATPAKPKLDLAAEAAESRANAIERAAACITRG